MATDINIHTILSYLIVNLWTQLAEGPQKYIRYIHSQKRTFIGQIIDVKFSLYAWLTLDKVIMALHKMILRQLQWHKMLLLCT